MVSMSEQVKIGVFGCFITKWSNGNTHKNVFFKNLIKKKFYFTLAETVPVHVPVSIPVPISGPFPVPVPISVPFPFPVF